MMEVGSWQEVESEVHQPGRWLLYTVGTIFFLIGTIGFATQGGLGQPGIAPWIVRAGALLFALCGAVTLHFAIKSVIFPARIRHAASIVLPQVPTAPVILNGSVAHGRLTHELEQTCNGWVFRPSHRLWRNDKKFVLGFGIPFSVVFAGILSWALHDQLKFATWPISILCGIAVTALCGGSTLILILMIIRAGYRRLCCLSIPANGNDLELEELDESALENDDLAAAARWALVGDVKRKRLTIARKLIEAVQLCPWKFVLGQSGERATTWAVQGLLVLRSSHDDVYHRLPILLTSDLPGASRLMQDLAHLLQVPYLFGADEAGWKAEELRAKIRPPLRIGGTQS